MSWGAFASQTLRRVELGVVSASRKVARLLVPQPRLVELFRKLADASRQGNRMPVIMTLGEVSSGFLFRRLEGMMECSHEGRTDLSVAVESRRIRAVLLGPCAARLLD